MGRIVLVFMFCILFVDSLISYTIDDRLSFFDDEKVQMKSKIDNEMNSVIAFYAKIGIVDTNATKKFQTLKIILSSDIGMLADGKIGEYNHETNSMTLNSSTLSSFNVLRFKDTLSHEMVHLIQFASDEFIIKDKINKPRLFRLEGEAQFFSHLYLLSQKIPASDIEGEITLRKTPSYLNAFKFYMQMYRGKYK